MSTIILDRFIELARRDPRKTTVVALVTFVMLALSCHFILEGPPAAPASIFPQPPSGNVTAEIVSLPPVISPDAVNQWLNEPRQAARRNLFALNLEDYPADSSANSSRINRLGSDQKDQAIWDDVAKSLAAQTDQKREHDFRVKNVQRAAARLSVQKIFAGPPLRAQVDGEVIEEGSFVASFRILRIATDRITVEKDGIPVDVPLN